LISTAADVAGRRFLVTNFGANVHPSSSLASR